MITWRWEDAWEATYGRLENCPGTERTVCALVGGAVRVHECEDGVYLRCPCGHRADGVDAEAARDDWNTKAQQAAAMCGTEE